MALRLPDVAEVLTLGRDCDEMLRSQQFGFAGGSSKWAKEIAPVQVGGRYSRLVEAATPCDPILLPELVGA